VILLITDRIGQYFCISKKENVRLTLATASPFIYLRT